MMSLEKLRGFLDASEPKVVRWLYRVWDKQQNDISYKELRQAITDASFNDEWLQQWRIDYAQLINDKLAPAWINAMMAGAEDLKRQYPSFVYQPFSASVREYTTAHGAELVTMVSQEQKKAMQALIAKASSLDTVTSDALAREIRPLIGLTRAQAMAVFNHYGAVFNSLHIDGGMGKKQAQERAQRASFTYAAKRHRERAFTIARTELARAYNMGHYGGTKKAQADGFLGDCVKVWLTAEDERVCPECGNLEGTTLEMDSKFNFKSRAELTPPAHPRCRCSVVFEEVDMPLNHGNAGTSIINEKNIYTFAIPAQKNPLQYNSSAVIIGLGGGRKIDDRNAGGLRRSPFIILSEKDIEFLKGEIAAIGANVSVFRFNEGQRTGYMDNNDIIDVMGDVFSDKNSTHPRDLMSERAVLAHEYYGHRENRGTPLHPNSWNDEFRASYLAAKNTPNLSDEDRMYLVMDSVERAKEAGVLIRYNQFMRRCLHGY